MLTKKKKDTEDTEDTELLKQFFLLMLRMPLTASIDKHYSITLDWYVQPSLPTSPETSPTAIEYPRDCSSLVESS